MLRNIVCKYSSSSSNSITHSNYYAKSLNTLLLSTRSSTSIAYSYCYSNRALCSFFTTKSDIPSVDEQATVRKKKNKSADSPRVKKYVDTSLVAEGDDEFIDLAFNEDDTSETLNDNNTTTTATTNTTTSKSKTTSNDYPTRPSAKDISGKQLINPLSKDRKKLKSMIGETAQLIKTMNLPQPADPSRWTKQDQLNFLEYMFDQLDYFEIQDWYKITLSRFLKLNGEGILRQNQQSAALCVINNYPEYKWDITQFSKSQPNFWTHKLHQRLLLDHIVNTAGLESANPHSWYKITFVHASSFKPFRHILKNSYDGNLELMLNTVYRFSPDGEIAPADKAPKLELASMHHSFRTKFDSAKSRLHTLLRKLLIGNNTSIYEFDPAAESSRQIMECVRELDNKRSVRVCVFREIVRAIPELHLKSWMFTHFDQWYRTVPNQHEYLDWFAREFSLRTPEDWYALPHSVIEPRLYASDCCLPSAIVHYYASNIHNKEHQWDFSRFQHLTVKNVNYKKDMKVRVIEGFGKSLGITELDQWYSITPEELKNFYDTYPQFKSLGRVLRTVYPDHPWDYRKFLKKLKV